MSFLESLGMAAAGSAVQGLIGSFFGNSAADNQVARNKELMGFQHELNLDAMRAQHDLNVSDYQHRYQWQMDDMRNAGLNPILSANLGAGSVSGTGIVGTGLAGSGVTGGTAFAGDVNSAASSYQRMSKIEKAQLNINQQNADAGTKMADQREREVTFSNLFNAANYRLNSNRAIFDWRMQLKDYILRETKQAADIANASKVADAQAGYYANAGAAALMQGEAALTNSSTGYQRYLMENETAGFIRNTNSALASKYNAEADEARARERDIRSGLPYKESPVYQLGKGLSPWLGAIPFSSIGGH